MVTYSTTVVMATTVPHIQYYLHVQKVNLHYAQQVQGISQDGRDHYKKYISK